jgi:hypothetical protein
MRRNFLLIPLMALLAAGCAVTAPPGIPPAARMFPGRMAPVNGLEVQRAVFTARGRQFALNGYLATSETGGKRLIVTETFGNMMADVLVKPGGKVVVVKSSRMFPERYIRRLLVRDVQYLFGPMSAEDPQVKVADTNHITIDRGGYQLDLHIVETKPGPQPAEMFDETALMKK